MIWMSYFYITGLAPVKIAFHLFFSYFNHMHPVQQRNMPFEWLSAPGLVPYPEAVAVMEKRVTDIREGSAAECFWLLEHPPLYTAGTSARAPDLKDARFPVFASGRGGQYTYHGPGQLVIYVMHDLQKRGGDVRRFVWQLEEWMIKTLAQFRITGERRQGRVGIWVSGAQGREDKIGAIGVRVRRGVSFHGLSLNINPDLSHYSGIVPCGIAEHGVTSLQDLGADSDRQEVEAAFFRQMPLIFPY